MLTEETLDQLKSINAIAWRGLLTFHYFKLASDQEGQFWALVQNVMGENCILLWCHIFGKRSDDLHYSKFFERLDVVETDELFRAANIKTRILSKIGKDVDQYDVFWNIVNDCRDKYISHRDLDNLTPVFPDIVICKDMIEELRIILFELISIHHKLNQEHEELDLMYRLYQGHPNSIFQSKCKNNLLNDIIDF